MNVLNLGFTKVDNLQNTGILELHFGRDGFSSNLGMGGVDASLGTLVSAFKGLEAWKVNYDIWTSDSKNAKEYIIGMRSLYSGSDKNRDLYQSILENTTNIVKKENAKETETIKNADGTNTIYLGSDALNDGSRFGLSVILSHESYRDGVKGTDEEQRLETDQAVMGHINTALGLMETYGVGSIGATMAGEAKYFSDNYNVLMSDKATAEQKEMAMTEIYGLLDSYDSSADYWKLVNKNGQWGWEADGKVSFNFDLRNPEIMEAYYQAGGIGYNGRLGAMEMTEDFLNSFGTALGIRDTQNSNTLSNFVNGSHALSDATLKAMNLSYYLLPVNKDSVDLATVNQKIASLNSSLMDVQDSGILFKTPVRKASYLNGKGTDDSPYLPLTGNVILTCLEGYRFVTENSFKPSKTYPLNDFAEAYHHGVDMKSSLYNVVASTDGSLHYEYDNTYGLRGILTSNSGNYEFISSHLSGFSAINYLNVFGMSGTSLNYNDNGTYTLTGVKAGVTFGEMGSTGFSTGDHIDFIVKNQKGNVSYQPFSIMFKNQYNTIKVTDWAKSFSGLQEKKPNEAIEKYLEAQRIKQQSATVAIPN